MFQYRRVKRANALRKEILTTRIELRREQLRCQAASLKAGFRADTASNGVNPLVQTLLSVAAPACIYFASRRRISLPESVRLGSAAVAFIRRILPVISALIRSRRAGSEPREKPAAIPARPGKSKPKSKPQTRADRRRKPSPRSRSVAGKSR